MITEQSLFIRVLFYELRQNRLFVRQMYGYLVLPDIGKGAQSFFYRYFLPTCLNQLLSAYQSKQMIPRKGSQAGMSFNPFALTTGFLALHLR